MYQLLHKDWVIVDYEIDKGRTMSLIDRKISELSSDIASIDKDIRESSNQLTHLSSKRYAINEKLNKLNQAKEIIEELV